jgi:hypothetical protein
MADEQGVYAASPPTNHRQVRRVTSYPLAMDLPMGV